MLLLLIKPADLLVIIQFDSSKARSSARGGMAIVLAVGALLAACIEEPQPRSFTEFMDDGIAREGVLIRCNEDRVATVKDPECVNARRAAAAIAAQEDEQQRAELDAQSEARLLAVRQRYDDQQAAERQAEIAAVVEEELAYESQWVDTSGEDPQAVAAPAHTPMESKSTAQVPSLEPVVLPASVRPPLTTIRLPRGVRPIELKPIEDEPAEPRLEEIVLPSRIKPTN